MIYPFPGLKRRYQAPNDRFFPLAYFSWPLFYWPSDIESTPGLFRLLAFTFMSQYVNVTFNQQF
jgi:hypothetical protein